MRQLSLVNEKSGINQDVMLEETNKSHETDTEDGTLDFQSIFLMKQLSF